MPDQQNASMLTDLRFWQQVHQEQRRTVLCTPAVADRVTALLEQHGLAGLFDVVKSELVDDGKILIIDHHAVDAAQRQALQRRVA